MRQSAKLVAGWAVVAAVFAHVTALLDGFVVAQEPRSPAVRSALGKILTEDRVAHSAYQVCEHTMRLPDEERFEQLTIYVLPSVDHDTLRLLFDMTPTCPAPVVESVLDSTPIEGATPRFSGGEFASPALELIRMAAKLGRLPELRQRIENWQPPKAEDRRCVAAMMIAIACAERDFPDAQTHLLSLIELSRVNLGDRLELQPEALGLWAAAEHPELRSLAEELSAVLFDDVRLELPHRIPRSERWKRLIPGKLQSILHPSETPSPTGTPQPMWIPVSRMLSETRGAGYPQPRWQIQPGRVSHFNGHDHDYLYYRSPLTGQFTVEADATTFGFRDIHMGFGGDWAGALYNLKYIVNGRFREELPILPINPPLTRISETIRFRMDVTDDKAELWINGRLAHTQERQVGGDPWLSIHSWWYTNGTVSDLRITGEPVIPEAISLVTPGLDGWVAYYGESFGGWGAEWLTQTGKRPTQFFERPEQTTPQMSEELEIYRRHRKDLGGTHSESLLRYHRPMIEDGTMEYEFFYEPGQTLVHPVLDRMCLILNPDGVDVHWATDGRHDPTGIEPNNIVSEPQHRRSKGPLPLKPAEWNRVTLMTVGDTVNLSLNGEPIYSRPLEATNLRTFGLFHWADQTEVRVRRMQWTGKWPKELPPLAEQSLADLSLEKSLGDRMQLESVIDHDFRQPLPPDLLSLMGDGWQSNIAQRDDGLEITRPGGHYVAYLVNSPAALHGDFDIIMEFDQFRPLTQSGAEGVVEFLVTLDDERASEHHIYRKSYMIDDRQEHVTQAAIFEKRGQDTQIGFLNAPAEEAVSGRLRMVRRGTTMYSLFAEHDSPHYRLVHRETVSSETARFRIQVCHHKEGQTSVLLKALDVRAASFSGVTKGPLKTLTELDAERLLLSAHKVWDFRSQKAHVPSAAFEDFKLFGVPRGSYSHSLEGLRIDVPGTDNWTAAGLLAIPQIEGDFDIALELDVLHMEPGKPSDESCVLLLTEFRDKLKTTIETKFSIHNGGDRKAKTQLRRLRRDKEFQHQELVSQPSDDAKLLRLARRGDVVYQIFQSSTQKTPVVLGAVQIGREPVLPGDLRMLIHTGGDKRMTSVRFRTLTVWAEKLIEPQQSSGKPKQ